MARNQPTFLVKRKIAEWLEAEDRSGQTAMELSQALKAETGIQYDDGSMRRLAGELGVTIRKVRGGRAVFRPNRLDDKVVVLAKAIRELAEALGHQLQDADHIKNIIARYKLNGQQPQEREEG
jgi:hypothetical protein